MTKYRAWTAKAVEYRVLEAAETAQTLPRTTTPARSGFWPEHVPLYPTGWSNRRVPSPGALTRMEECWAWINAHPDQEERRLVYAWSWVKTRKGEKIADFAERESVKVRSLRDKITSIFQRLASKLNRDATVRFSTHVDDAAENLVREQPDIVAEVPTHPNYWHSPDIKPPRHQPVLYVQTAPGKRRAG